MSDGSPANVPVPVLTQQLATRIEACLAEGGVARRRHVAALPGNPVGFEVRRFDHLEAVACRRPVGHYGYFSGLRGVVSGDEERLDAPLAWLREAGVVPTLSVSPFFADEALLRDLAQRRLHMSGFMTVFYGVPVVDAPAPAAEEMIQAGAGVTVERVAASDETGFRPFLDIWLATASDDRALRDRLLRAELKDWQCYVALVDGVPAGVGAMYVSGKAALVAAGSTLPEWRGRGCQTAVLRRRVSDAAAAGCDLVVSQARPGTQSQRNMERAGLRTAYTSVSFSG